MALLEASEVKRELEQYAPNFSSLTAVLQQCLCAQKMQKEAAKKPEYSPKDSLKDVESLGALLHDKGIIRHGSGMKTTKCG